MDLEQDVDDDRYGVVRSADKCNENSLTCIEEDIIVVV